MSADSDHPSRVAFVVLGPVVTVLVFVIVGVALLGAWAAPFSLAVGLVLALTEYLFIRRLDWRHGTAS